MQTLAVGWHGSIGNLQRAVDIRARHLIRLPRDIVRGNPRVSVFLSRVCLFQLVGRRLGPSGIDAVLETPHDGGVPGRVKIRFSRTRIDLDAIAAEVRVVRGMQWLMDVADKMDQKRQIAFGAPAIVVALFQALRVFVDFRGHAFSTGAACGNVGSPILQTNVDEVPSRRRPIFLAKLVIRTIRSNFHRSRNRSFVRRDTQDVRHMARSRRRKIVGRNNRDDFVPVRPPTPRHHRTEQGNANTEIRNAKRR